MPTIAAGSYPVESIPSVEPAATPNSFQRIDANPLAFGAGIGAAESGLAGQFEKAGGEFAQQALARQDLYNNTTADQQSNNWYDQANDIQSKFFTKRGQDAMDAYPQAKQDIMNARLQAGNTLNPLARLKFEEETRRLQAYMMSSMDRHYDQEFKTYTDSVAQASYKNGQTQMANAIASGNEDNVDTAIAKQLDAGHTMLKARGLDGNPEEVTKMENEVKSNYIKQRTEHIAQSDPMKALDFLEHNQGLVGDEYNELHSRYQTKARQTQSAIDAGIMPPLPAGTYKTPKGLIDYKPATGILEGTGLSADQWNTYRHYVASREASGYGEPPNKQGYMGQYQMGSKEIADAAGRLNIPVPSQEEFLSNPALQEKLFENYTLANHNTLMQALPAYANASPKERAAILMGAHIGGVGSDASGKGVVAYINSGIDHHDVNGTSIGNYVNSMRRVMNSGMTSEKSGNIEVWGDSLGVGLAPQLNAGGKVHSGDSPETIFNNIKAVPEASWQGKTVVLSSGSNADQMPVVEDTIKYLQDKGAHVIAVGYGTKGQLPERNAALREIAGRLNVPVVDAENINPSEGVHPTDYSGMVKKISSLANSQAPAQLAPSAGTTQAGQSQALTGDQIVADPNFPMPKLDFTLPPLETGEQPDADIPGMAQSLDHIMKTIPADQPQRRLDAVKYARGFWNAQYQAQRQQHQIDKEKDDAQQEQLKNSYLTRMAPGELNPPTIREIMADPKLKATTKENLVAFSERNGKEDPAAPYDAQTKNDLYSRIQLPYGTPGKITTTKELDDAYHNQKLTWNSLQQLTKVLDDSKSANGENIARQRSQLLNTVRGAILGPTALTEESRAMDSAQAVATGRESGEQRLSRFIYDMDKKITDAQGKGEDYHELFNPYNKAKYLGSNDALKAYLPPIAEKLKAGTTSSGVLPYGASLQQMDELHLKAFASQSPKNYDLAVDELARRGNALAIEEQKKRPATAPEAK